MNLTIDNKNIRISKPGTILDIADKNGIYIPRMCAHPELVPYGGCRLCMVEIEGNSGYPTACTTEVREGMTIRTNTNTLQQMRLDLLQLILSEHPSACLLCEDVEGCSKFQETIRKVGVTTGCRWCPKDKDCELQRIVESFDINELSLPGLYRDLPVEKYDPFFDRDYNLCIYCGRCVRICNEYRLSSVITLKQRGKNTTIGPSFESDHTDAGCEYCGACVSVCPTGAMSEKSRKWWGIHDKTTKSVCPLCSINCEIQVISQRDKIVGTIPPGIPHEAAGELCVKGRFCLSEIINRTERILEPQYLYPEGRGIVNWKEALSKGGELLANVQPGRTALFVSPDLSIEEYNALAVFADKVLKTNIITSSVLDFNMISYQQLALSSAPIDTIKQSGIILSLFLNGNYNFGPLTMTIKGAANSGVPYYNIGWLKDTTSRFVTDNLTPLPGEELSRLDQIIDYLSTNKCDNEIIRKISDGLKNNTKSILIAGPWILSLSNCIMILDRIKKIAELTGSAIYMPDPYGNMKGMTSCLELKPVETVIADVNEKRIDLVYLVGDMPFKRRPRVKNVIYQSAFPYPEDLKPDLVLPTTIWGESPGTWQGANGNPVKIKRLAKAHEYAKSNIDIIGRLSTSAGDKQAKESINKAAKRTTKLSPNIPEIDLKISQTESVQISDDLPFVLIQERSPHTYMNIKLDKALEGLNELVSPDHLLLNPVDAESLEIKSGEVISVMDNRNKISLPVKTRKNIQKGTIYLLSVNDVNTFPVNPCYVKIRRANV